MRIAISEPQPVLSSRHTSPVLFLILVIMFAGCNSRVANLQQAMRDAFYANQQMGLHLRSKSYTGVLDQARVVEAAVPMLRAYNDTEEFQAFVNDYESSVQDLIKSAEQEDEPGAQAAITSLRAACAQCHRVYRTE